jgi:hypothetical protein
MDLIPEYERSVLNAAVKHAEPPIVKVSSRFVAILWNILFLLYLWGTGVFVLYFAYTRMEKIQEIWGFTFLGWFLLDIVLVQTSDAFLRYHWCTYWCKSSVAAAISVIKQNLASVHSEPEFMNSVPGETNPLRIGDASNRLNLILFSSAQIIAHFLKLGVTQSRAMDLIAKFGSPFPQYRLVEREQIFSRFAKALLNFFYKKSFVMLIFVHLPPRMGALIMQELVIVFWCGVAYLAFAVLTEPVLWHWVLIFFAGLCLLWLLSQDGLIACLQWLDSRDDDSSDADADIIIQDRPTLPSSDVPVPPAEPIPPAEASGGRGSDAQEAGDASSNDEASELESAESSAEDASADQAPAQASSLPRPPSTTTAANAPSKPKPTPRNTPAASSSGPTRKPAPSTSKKPTATAQKPKPNRNGDSSFHM